MLLDWLCIFATVAATASVDVAENRLKLLMKLMDFVPQQLTSDSSTASQLMVHQFLEPGASAASQLRVRPKQHHHGEVVSTRRATRRQAVHHRTTTHFQCIVGVADHLLDATKHRDGLDRLYYIDNSMLMFFADVVVGFTLQWIRKNANYFHDAAGQLTKLISS